MEFNMSEIDEDKPWDIKTLTLSLGGVDDSKGFLTFQFFADDGFNIYEGDERSGGVGFLAEEIDIAAAKRLRDFLIYAIPKDNPDATK